MKTPSRALRVLGAAGLIIGLLAAMVAPVTAQQGSPDGPARDMPFQTSSPGFRHGANTIYYPWVANDEDFGLGPADTAIAVQNLEDRDAQIWIYVGDGNGSFSLVTTAFLSRFASKTFTAEALGIAEGSGAPVAVSAYHLAPAVGEESLIETEIELSRPEGVGAADEAQVTICVPMRVIEETEATEDEEAEPSYTEPAPFMLAIDELVWGGQIYEQGDLVPWSSQDELQSILNSVNTVAGTQLINPFGGLNQDGDCLDALVVVEGTGEFLDSVAIGGIAKAAVDGEMLPMTSGADTAVSGYNALNGAEMAQFDQWYLPIVQTNGEPGGNWNSLLRVSNIGAINNAVTVRFFPSDDGSGSLNTGFQLHSLVDGGDTWHIDLSEYVPEGWVGSAHIQSDGAVFAMVDRYKVGYNMWLTNTGSSADFENIAQVENAQGQYVLFAPHVLMDYFGWNTGINVANLVIDENNVSVQYFNMLGNATETMNRRLAAHGMTYFYDPSQAPQNESGQDVVTDVNANTVGSALIWSDYPVAAVIDATKYPESDPTGRADLFQATSYSATANVYTWQAVPLVQKGNPIDGMGTTSGINIMNPNATAATANVYFVNQSGFNAKNFGISSVTIPAFANGFVYTLTQHNLPNGFYGAAQVISDVPVAAVSANVNYQVDGDGSAIFNAFNPCGLYLSGGFTTLLDEQGQPVLDADGEEILVPACSFGDPFDTTGGSVTKTFVDPSGEPVVGVQFHIIGDNPDFSYQRQGVSGVDGTATLTNVPVGNYELNVEVVPPGYALPENPADEFTLNQGDDWAETNTIPWNQGVMKTVLAFGDETMPVSGIDVAIYTVVGEDGGGDPIIDDVPVFVGSTNVEGISGANLAPGDYMLCIYADSAGVAMVGDTVVTPVLPTEPDFESDDCEVFEVEADLLTELVNSITVDGDLGDLDLTVTPGNLQGAEIQESDETEIVFVEGPGTLPAGLGEGSMQFNLSEDANDYARFMVSEFDGMLLSDLTELSYWTYVQQRPATSQATAYLVIRLDTDGDGIQNTEHTLYFEPVYQTASYGAPEQGPAVVGTWQQWDAVIGTWRTFNQGSPPVAGDPDAPQTLAVIADLYPGATIHPGADGAGGIHIASGTGGPAVDGNSIHNVDGLTIGAEGTGTITYDFEP